MHLRYNIMMIDVGSILVESGTVNVEGRSAESVLVVPLLASGRTRNKVERFHWMVEVAEIHLGISVGSWLVLGLSEQDLMFIIGEVLALFGIKVNVITINLWSTLRGVTIPALDS